MWYCVWYFYVVPGKGIHVEVELVDGWVKIIYMYTAYAQFE